MDLTKEIECPNSECQNGKIALIITDLISGGAFMCPLCKASVSLVGSSRETLKKSVAELASALSQRKSDCEYSSIS